MSWGLFRSIDYEGEALEAIKSITNWFFVLAAINALFAILNPLALIDAAIYFGVAYWFRRTHSRAASIILLVLAALLLYVVATASIPSLFGIGIRIFMVILSIRGVEAAFKLYRLTAAKAATGGGGPAGRPSAAVDATGDLEILRQLKKAGSDLSKPHLPEFLFAFPNEAAAQEAVGKIRAMGYEAEITPPMPGREWPVRAQRSMVLTEEALKRARYHFERIARAGAGTYDGWGAPAVT
jgi:Regulator of ribonuclease activity B